MLLFPRLLLLGRQTRDDVAQAEQHAHGETHGPLLAAGGHLRGRGW